MGAGFLKGGLGGRLDGVVGAGALELLIDDLFAVEGVDVFDLKNVHQIVFGVLQRGLLIEEFRLVSQFFLQKVSLEGVGVPQAPVPVSGAEVLVGLGGEEGAPGQFLHFQVFLNLVTEQKDFFVGFLHPLLQLDSLVAIIDVLFKLEQVDLLSTDFALRLLEKAKDFNFHQIQLQLLRNLLWGGVFHIV